MMELWAIWMDICLTASTSLGLLMVQMQELSFIEKGKFNCTNVCGTLKIQPNFDCYFVSLVLQQATQKYVSSNLANPKLMNNTMASIKISMPNIEAQRQLSKMFQTLDSCLSVHKRTYKMYLKEKQYLLRQMFI